MYPGNAPPFGVTLVAVVVVVIVGVHGARRHLRGVELAAAKQARRRIHHGRARDIEAILGGIHGAGGCGRQR
jgi:heme exporter protein D